MKDLTKRVLERRVEIVLKEFLFATRQKRDITECTCYDENKPCHNIPSDELNCYFCLCPEYDNSKEEGGCKIEDPEGKGKWFDRPDLEAGHIWDCSDCTYPHKTENIIKYLNRDFGLTS